MKEIQERIANLSAKQKTLFDLLCKQKALNSPKIEAIPKRKRAQFLPLSFGQQRLWFLDQLVPGSHFYNEPLLAIRLTGLLNIAALEQAINEIVRRHESLRTIFPSIKGKPVQVILPNLPMPMPVIDLRELQVTDPEPEFHRLALQEAQHLFDLARGPLLRVSLLKMDREEHIAFLEMHHIISDGWSVRVLLREIAVLYEAFSKGIPSPLPELPIQYADFAIWQRQWLQGDVLEDLISYWKQQLGDNLPKLDLPTDFPRLTTQTFRGAIQSLTLPKTLSEDLKNLSCKVDVTLFMTLLAAFKTLLYRYTRQEDIVVGSPIANRNWSEIEGLIGFFSNTLVLRTDLSGNPRFCDLIGRVREMAVGAYEHQDLPFEKLVQVLQPERSLSNQVLFQVLFGLHNYPVKTLEVQGLTLTHLEIDGGESKFDIALNMTDLGEAGLVAHINYSTDLFKATTINRMLIHFETLLYSIVANPEARLNALEMLSEDERKQESTKEREEEAYVKKLREVKRKVVSIKY